MASRHGATRPLPGHGFPKAGGSKAHVHALRELLSSSPEMRIAATIDLTSGRILACAAAQSDLLPAAESYVLLTQDILRSGLALEQIFVEEVAVADPCEQPLSEVVAETPSGVAVVVGSRSTNLGLFAFTTCSGRLGATLHALNALLVHLDTFAVTL